MSKPTKGPFEVKKDAFDDSFYIRCKGARKGDGYVIERIVAQGIDLRADAKMFAAAPEVLEALQELLHGTFPEGVKDDGSGRIGFNKEAVARYEKAERAIAKALGK